MKDQKVLYVVPSRPNSSYKHRTNKDGTFDSICLCCYRTIATAHDESLLETAESGHQCKEADLERYLYLRAIASSHRPAR
jgi:hypothetical protein